MFPGICENTITNAFDTEPIPRGSLHHHSPAQLRRLTLGADKVTPTTLRVRNLRHTRSGFTAFFGAFSERLEKLELTNCEIAIFTRHSHGHEEGGRPNPGRVDEDAWGEIVAEMASECPTLQGVVMRELCVSRFPESENYAEVCDEDKSMLDWDCVKVGVWRVLDGMGVWKTRDGRMVDGQVPVEDTMILDFVAEVDGGNDDGL